MKRELIETSDPQLTAYALGELEPDEVVVFERQLVESPTAKAELDDIRETVQWLRDGFATEAMRHADEKARASVLTNTSIEDSKVVKADFKYTPTMKSMLLGLAAVLTGLLVVGSLMTQGPKGEGPLLAGKNPGSGTGVESNATESVKPEMSPIIQDTVIRPSGAVVKVRSGGLEDLDPMPNSSNVPVLNIVEGNDNQLVSELRGMTQPSKSGIPGFADASSYLTSRISFPRKPCGSSRRNSTAFRG